MNPAEINLPGTMEGDLDPLADEAPADDGGSDVVSKGRRASGPVTPPGGTKDGDTDVYIPSFTCVSRERDADNPGQWLYYVHPVGDLDELNLEGKDVRINEVVRRCKEFWLDDEGTIVIVVDQNAV